MAGVDAVKSRSISLPIGNRTPISRAPKLIRLFFEPEVFVYRIFLFPSGAEFCNCIAWKLLLIPCQTPNLIVTALLALRVCYLK